MLRVEFQTNIQKMAFLHSDMELYVLLWDDTDIFLIDLAYIYMMNQHNMSMLHGAHLHATDLSNG